MHNNMIAAFWSNQRKPVISAMLLLYIVSIGLFLSPATQGRDFLLAPFRPAIKMLGLWQNFRTFGPDPPALDYRIDARITFADGSSQTWSYPHVETVHGFERYVKDRYRRALLIRSMTADPVFFRAIAEYAARLSDNGTRHPRLVEVIQHAERIKPLTDDDRIIVHPATNGVVFTYRVNNPGKLTDEQNEDDTALTHL